MNASLRRYQEFIDGFVRHASRNQKAEGLRRRYGLPPRRDGYVRMAVEDFQSLADSLSPEDRERLVRLMEVCHEDGVHETLRHLNDRIANGLRIVDNGVELPVRPFDDLQMDWLYRLDGGVWPEER